MLLNTGNRYINPNKEENLIKRNMQDGSIVTAEM